MGENKLVNKEFFDVEVLDKIKEELKNNKNRENKEKHPIRLNIFINLCVAIFLEFFYGVMIQATSNMSFEKFVIDMNVFITFGTIFAIVLLEWGYRKKRNTYFLYGVEAMVITFVNLAISSLYRSQNLSTLYTIYIGVAVVVLIYYLAKSVFIGIKRKKIETEVDNKDIN